MFGPPSPAPSDLMGEQLSSRSLSTQQIYIPVCVLIAHNVNAVTKERE